MDTTTLANHIRIHTLDRQARQSLIDLDDQDTIEFAATCPDCGELYCQPSQLGPIVEKSRDLLDFCKRVVGACAAGTFDEYEQDILQNELRVAIHRGTQKIIASRGQNVVQDFVYNAYIEEAALFARQAFRNANG